MKKCTMGVEDQKCPANYAILVVGIKGRWLLSFLYIQFCTWCNHWSKREPALNIPNSVIYVEYRKQFLDKIIK